ncbi:MAG: phosphatidylglycerophosphatase A [Candidatus Binatia bacterium]
MPLHSPLEETSAPVTRLAVVLATGFGSGLSPFAPGTAGTLVAVPLALLLLPAGFFAQALVVAVVIAASIWSAGVAAPTFGLKDPGQIVVDEIAGFFVTVAFLPTSWTTLAAGFLLFRLFDIWKPPPCRWAETLPGGLGIVSDDLLAGLYANFVIRVCAFFGILSL